MHKEHLPRTKARSNTLKSLISVLSTINDFSKWRPEDLQMMAIGNLRNARSISGGILTTDTGAELCI